MVFGRFNKLRSFNGNIRFVTSNILFLFQCYPRVGSRQGSMLGKKEISLCYLARTQWSKNPKWLEDKKHYLASIWLRQMPISRLGNDALRMFYISYTVSLLNSLKHVPFTLISRVYRSSHTFYMKTLLNVDLFWKKGCVIWSEHERVMFQDRNYRRKNF